jgi:hypothetical protein
MLVNRVSSKQKRTALRNSVFSGSVRGYAEISRGRLCDCVPDWGGSVGARWLLRRSQRTKFQLLANSPGLDWRGGLGAYRDSHRLWPAVSRPLNQTVAFILFAAGWSFACSLLLNSSIHPVAVFIVWIIGFVWGVGYIIAGKIDADLLLKRWLQMMAGAMLLGFVGSFLLS